MTESGVKSTETQLVGEFVRRVEAIQPAVWAALLGALIIFSVGFAQPQALHDAAHDSRHAHAFPCH
jgi:cobalt transporter subunit CbtB